MRVDAGRFVVFLMGCRRCYLQVDSIFSGKSRTGEMSMSLGSVGLHSPIGLSCQMLGPRCPEGLSSKGTEVFVTE